MDGIPEKCHKCYYLTPSTVGGALYCAHPERKFVFPWIPSIRRGQGLTWRKSEVGPNGNCGPDFRHFEPKEQAS